jgi:hypothetical protein
MKQINNLTKGHNMAKTIVPIVDTKSSELAKSLKSYGKTVNEIATIMGKSKSRVYELLRGINYLPTK